MNWRQSPADSRLFELMARPLLRSLVKFPEEADFGLTDEQYVRNVVESIYRKAR